MVEPLMRIGTLAQRVGVSPDTLRAWERRYGVPTPGRTDRGYRLYSTADEARVRLMLAHMMSGLAPAQAAELARADYQLPAGGGPLRPADVAGLRGQLLAACIEFDAAGAHETLDAAQGQLALRDLIEDVFLWCLHQIGIRWETGDGSIAEEHFAAALIRERLLVFGRDWDAGSGPRALLACPAGERHDVGLIAAGVWLGRLGWRVTFLGPDTPADSIAQAAVALAPAAVLLAATVPEGIDSALPAVRAPLYLAGPGGSARAGDAPNVIVLPGGPIEVAGVIDREFRAAAVS